ncbi:winged helix DNA-binding protein [Haloactinopolyspora alba]|uniref:Winged helix DNA-binding protein n=2 Tax=Haloactinopolyspora alba TaxID=648780 RepID=A0A2P8EG86_9ACTN|nr:winged helix DNA-binding protein [Haloactinopolyspora alba]
MRRHRLASAGPVASAPAEPTVPDVADAVVALHATDPASVYLSVLARNPTATLADVSDALYEDRSVVKLLGMRRTMFVVPTGTGPVVHAGAAAEVAQRLRRRLVKELRTVPTEPEIDGDADAWLTDVEDGAERVLLERGEALANQVAAAEPRLRTALLPTTDKKWDTKQNVTSRVLTLMGAEGRLVRGRPAGTWQSRQHRWAPARALWPEGLPPLPEDEARTELARQWLRAFGPGTVADLQWWTGWTLGATRKTLARLDTVEVDLDGTPGIVLADDVDPDPRVEPSAALLPALDPTPMGWQGRDWFLGAHRDALFDRNGNIGPTVWWDGRVVGGWGMRGDEIVWRLLEDIGTEAAEAVAGAAARLQPRLESASVTPTFRTPLERELAG